MAYTAIGQPAKRPPHRHIPFPPGSLPSVQISLVRSGCYGDCPIYSLSITGHGVATYTGYAFVAVKGKHVTQVSADDLEQLVGAFRAADFFSLYPRYAYPVSDNSTYRLSIRIGGRTKTVDDYVGVPAGMPKAVVDLERAVDTLAGSERWVTGDEHTLIALDRERFDFASPAGALMLRSAAQVAPDNVVLGLLARGASPLVPAIRPELDPEVRWPATAIEAALLRGRVAVVQALIAHGALASDALKVSALSAAARSGRVQLLSEVLKTHPPLDQLGWDDETALSSAAGAYLDDDIPEAIAGHMRAQCVQVLLAAGADAHQRNKDGSTALHHSNSAEVTSLLIAAGANVNARDDDGAPPLLSTVDEESAKLLIAAGADLTARADNGTGLAEWANQWKWISITPPASKP